MRDTSTKSIRMEITAMKVINFALQQNNIPIIQSFQIVNDTETALEHIELDVSANPVFCLPFHRHIDLVPANSVLRVNVELKMDPEYLCSLTERINGNLYFSLSKDNRALALETVEISALAYDEWQGLQNYPELLAAFVTPNHPQIVKITSRAAQLLEKWTDDPSLDAYQTQDINRVLSQAAAIYGAIQEQNIVYAVPPASFSAAGQRVRLCDTILQQKMATCLDLSVLYAACLESIGLNPILVSRPGHIFAGFWLEDMSFPETIQDDASLITKRLASGISQIAVVECTAMTAGKKMNFDSACSNAEQQLTLGDVEEIIDIHRARLSGVLPIPSRIKTESGWVVERPEVSAKHLTDAPRALTYAMNTGDAQAEEFSKKVQWERKLLDLGLRNNLINMRLSRSTVPILTTSLDDLENALNEGKDFAIHPRPGDLHWNQEPTLDSLHDLQGNDTLIASEFKNKRLRSAYTETELSNALKNLYRNAKTALEENGANTLYLALGLLRWYETPKSTKPRFAPIILLPVELVRKSVRQGYVLRLRDDDPQMNITVLEKIKQDFRIQINGLDPLPMDEKGIDTRKVFTILRQGIMNQPRWDVLESAYLGIFSFSQFVMWNDIRNRSEDLAKNKIVRSLMDGKLCWEANEMAIGDRVPEDDVFLPLSADASQLYAIEAATQGESFVLHGPPGTGKSQTITTLIANALAQGKTVLFVAEKMAALEVVQRRLTNIGIGNFCLELHSNKSKKRDVLDQLRYATEVTKTITAEQYAAKAQQIAAVRKDLDKYAASLHKPLTSGKTLFDLLNAYEANCDAPEVAPFPGNYIQDLGPGALDTHATLLNRLVAAAKAVGHPYQHPLAPVGCTAYSQNLRYSLGQYAQQYRRSIIDLQTAYGQFCRSLCLAEEPGAAAVRNNAGIAQELELWKNFPAGWAIQDDPAAYLSHVEQMARHFHNAAGLYQQLNVNWTEEFFRQDARSLLQQWDTATGKWFLARTMGQNSLYRQLRSYARTNVEKDSIRNALCALAEFQQENTAAQQFFNHYGKDLGAFCPQDPFGWQPIMDKAAAARHSAQKLDQVYNAKAIRTGFTAHSPAAQSVASFLSVWNRFCADRDAFYGLLAIQADETCEDLFLRESRICDDILTNTDALKDWIAWNAIVKDAENSGLTNITDAYRQGLAHEQVLNAYHKAISTALIISAVDSDDTLRSFSGAVFNEKIRQFKQLDEEMMKLTQQEIYFRLAAKVPNFAKEAAHSSELGILQRAIRSGGRGISIRKLFEQIPNLLPRLCPCMLMSPISASQYLDPKQKHFDLVVFDEASQLPTCKAVGVLARGSDAVIVGDPKQMPPTAFFATNSVDEENLDVEDLESILDDCLALNMPQTHLLWHYRSRHESLIAYSNARFYESKLYTFPSVNDRECKVSLIHVDGVFERGKQRQNRAEAEAIIAELKRRCHDPLLRNQSVGIVTFNINQQHLIDDLLSDACREDPDLETWAFQSEEPLFIKNLENVQGDERDVILFSIGYGPDENGKVYMNFGPLNRDGGWRRLNVAITRARQEMTVYATLKPEQIDLNRTSAQGVSALKGFLTYAQTKQLPVDDTSVSIQADTRAGIADSICTFLEEQGYETVRSVGSSKYRIDIGVVDPQSPDSYLLGILLDGSSYVTSKTTRDREIAQISVLNGLGWNIHRVWTMDWWDNCRKELQAILARLEECKQAAIEKAEKLAQERAALEQAALEESVSASAVKIPEEPTLVEKEAPAPVEATAQEEAPVKLASAAAVEEARNVYTPAKLACSQVSAEDFLLPRYAPAIRKKVTAVINAEAPVSRDQVTRRILQSYGISRAGSRIQTYMDGIYGSMALKATKQEKEVFFWTAEQDPTNFKVFRTAADDESRRDASDICIQEAAAAVYFALEEQISLSQADLIREGAKLLGFNRLGSSITKLMEYAIAYNKEKGRIVVGTNGNWTTA